MNNLSTSQTNLVSALINRTAIAEAATLDEWIELGKEIRPLGRIDGAPSVRLVAQIQVLLVDAGLISDKEFVQLVTGGEYD